MPAGPRVPSRRGPESALGDQHPEGTAPRPHSHLPALTRLPSYSPWGSRRLGLLGCWAGEARSPLATPGGRGRAQLATDWNVSPAGRHLVSICPAQLGPTSKGPPPGHFLCPGRPQGRHQDGPASSPPLCSPHQRGHPPPPRSTNCRGLYDQTPRRRPRAPSSARVSSPLAHSPRYAGPVAWPLPGHFPQLTVPFPAVSLWILLAQTPRSPELLPPGSGPPLAGAGRLSDPAAARPYPTAPAATHGTPA